LGLGRGLGIPGKPATDAHESAALLESSLRCHLIGFVVVSMLVETKQILTDRCGSGGADEGDKDSDLEELHCG